MKREMFQNVLSEDEELLFAEGVNKRGFVAKKIGIYIFVSAGFAFFISVFSTVMMMFANFGNFDFQFNPFGNMFSIWIISFVIGIVIFLISSILEANNTYFAITNKRIIKRGGTFNISFIHYSLKNIGTVNVSGGIVDSRGEDASASLIVTVKDFHTNMDGNTSPMQIAVESLNSAYKAYNLLSSKVEGNNESLRVQIEK